MVWLKCWGCGCILSWLYFKMNLDMNKMSFVCCFLILSLGIVVFFDLHLSHPSMLCELHVEIQGTGWFIHSQHTRITHHFRKDSVHRQDDGGTTTLGRASKGKAGRQLGYCLGGGSFIDTFHHHSGGGVLRRIQKLLVRSYWSQHFCKGVVGKWRWLKWCPLASLFLRV